MAYLDDIYAVLQVAPTGVPTYVRLSQNENGRRMYFSVVGGEIPTGSTATISGTKPDGVVYSASCSINGSTVTVNETIQLTAAAGEWDAKLKIMNGGQTIATGRIRFVIDADTVAPGSVPSDSELEGLVAEAAGYAEAAKDAAYYGSPLMASTVAEMTDHNRVYVYAGSESGYTSGNWYFWDGSAWTSGGVYNATAVQTDKTLKVADMAADAKAVGDALAEVQVETDKTLTQADVPADAKAVGDKLTSLKADLTNVGTAILECFKHVEWLDAEGSVAYDALESALNTSPVKSISANFAQAGAVFSSTDELDDLRPFLTVTATLSDDTTEVVTDYTLTGELYDAVSFIGVIYRGKTTTFSVNVAQLPSGYTAKSYILSDGTQYIATSIPETALENCWIRYKALRTGTEDRAGHIFSSTNYYVPYLFIYGTDLTTRRFGGNRFGTAVDPSNRYLWEVNKDYTIVAYKRGNVVEINGVDSVSIEEGSTSSASNMMTILGYGTNATFRHRGRLYMLKVFTDQNVKKYDFIPCVNDSNVTGLYDLVNRVFYAPATGTLIAE